MPTQIDWSPPDYGSKKRGYTFAGEDRGPRPDPGQNFSAIHNSLLLKEGKKRANRNVPDSSLLSRWGERGTRPSQCVAIRSARTAGASLALAFARLRRFGFLHLLTAARGNLLVRGDRLGHSTRDALITGLRLNHVPSQIKGA